MDSDFDIDEGDEPGSDQDDSEPKRKRRVVTKAYKVRRPWPVAAPSSGATRGLPKAAVTRFTSKPLQEEQALFFEDVGARKDEGPADTRLVTCSGLFSNAEQV